jgi:periplasmic protein TonB
VEAAPQSAESLRVPLIFSVALHSGLLVLLLVSALFSHRGDSWGGPGGGAITVGLVGSVPGVTLPRPDVVTNSRVVDETKGLYKAEPPPKTQPADETLIPKFAKDKPPRYITAPSRILEDKTPPPPGAIPYGQGGAPAIPYSSFALGSGTQAGMGFPGAGGGNFGARFPWYVQAVQRRISSNWLQSTVDPSVRFAPRAVATFSIGRDGTVTSIQITKSSGNPSVDNSAVRAIRESSPLDRLPPEYSNGFVNVEFWFDFKR